VLGPSSGPEPADTDAVEDALRLRIASGMTARDAVAEVAAELSVPKRRVYDVANSLT